MENQLSNINTEILSSLILKGDISGLNSTQRVQYVTNLCQRIGLDPLTQPFKILKLQGKEVLYADKGCAQQLCKVYQISTEVTKREKIEDIYIVTVRATGKDGRFTDEDGAVTIGASKGDILCNAMMKAVTKAKRRAVLAYCGLGMLDETEIETIPKAVTIELPNPEEEAKIELDKKIQAMRRAIMDIKIAIGDKAWAEVLTWHKVADVMLLEDLALGKTIYQDMKNQLGKNKDGKA